MQKNELDIQQVETLYGLPVYPKRGINIIKGKGAYVWDEKDNRYIDCTGGHGVVPLGHCHPAITRAITQQAKTLVACSNIFNNDIRAQALNLLAKVTQCKKLFLCNSGAEAIEAAIKLARLLTGKQKIISMTKGFHGRTCGALSLTWNPKYREPFGALLPAIEYVSLNDLNAIETAATPDTAAIVIEIIQGEGGVNLAGIDYLKSLRRLCTQKNMLLIIDEIQTGFGRTGKMFAHQHADIQPDIMAMAKGIANGVPMGAVAFYLNTEDKIKPGQHGSTFGGSPLACAACVATIETLLQKHLPEKAARLGKTILNLLRKELRDINLIKDIRGQGLMIGIELRQRVQPIIQTLMERNILVLPAGPTVLRLLPPLTIKKQDLMKGIETIIDVLKIANQEFIKT